MKKFLFTLFFALFSVGLFAGELNDAQKKVRSGIMLFLKEEGYMPELDTDGDILFKKEGTKYYVRVGDSDTNPMYVLLYHSYRYDDTYTKNRILSVLNDVNLYKVVKLLCFDTSYSFRAEMYLVNAEQFKYTFYKLMSQLSSMEKELEKLCSRSTSNAPVSASSSLSTATASVVKQFFPIHGVTLGKTTSDDLRKLGYTVETNKSGNHSCEVNSLDFWDFNNDNMYEELYMTCYDSMPETWIYGHGFRWDLSYDQWLKLFKEKKFSVVVNESPIKKKYEKRMTLSAKFTATSEDNSLKFVLDFDYGNDNKEGYNVYSKNSLYSMSVTALS